MDKQLKPLQGLSAWLRNEAARHGISICRDDEHVQAHIATLQAWAREVDAALASDAAGAREDQQSLIDNDLTLYGVSFTLDGMRIDPERIGMSTAPRRDEVAAFIRDVSDQKPEKPDHWSSCGQCERNIERAQEILESNASRALPPCTEERPCVACFTDNGPCERPANILYDAACECLSPEQMDKFEMLFADADTARRFQNCVAKRIAAPTPTVAADAAAPSDDRDSIEQQRVQDYAEQNMLTLEEAVDELRAGAPSDRVPPINAVVQPDQFAHDRNMVAQPDERWVFGYAKMLAEGIWERCYRDDAPQWKPLDDTLGILTQIDNMIAGMTRAKTPSGWKLVPHEPTKEMLSAGREQWHRIGTTTDAWQAMYCAAPDFLSEEDHDQF